MKPSFANPVFPLSLPQQQPFTLHLNTSPGYFTIAMGGDEVFGGKRRLDIGSIQKKICRKKDMMEQEKA